jgi:hypothetical protein
MDNRSQCRGRYQADTEQPARERLALADMRCEEKAEPSGALRHLDVRLAEYVRPKRSVCVESLP